ncbi:hypothetical protein J0A67_08000 [Algoriphagus aestuariicola]|uniref:Ligand-binding sensor domain-containing protein n=1 Tax=Algoriphagus aestuariicola TaxID=1852016 RepID=A0ABS3BNQ8_9BACT|nr:two-component regulator propeller domain-containing protein [Algoriphagus aestuariicola]MBN7800798.1 hypothetical protein [Algoriphagus aestuariicola]
MSFKLVYGFSFFALLQLLILILGVQVALAQKDTFVPDSSGIAKDYVMEFWDNTMGLPQNAVFALEKDNSGYLWIATEEGLVRFDGGFPKVFDQENYPEMLEQTYYAFFKTPAGIWASSDRSIALLEKNIKKVIDCSEITEKTWIRSIVENGEGGLLIGNQKGQIHSWTDGVFSLLDFWKPSVKLEILGFFSLENSKLLVGTNRGLYELDLKSKQANLVSSIDFSAQKIFGTVGSIHVYSPDSGIFRLKEDYSLEQLLTYEQSKGINPSSLVLDSEGKIWAGSLEKGLILVENGIPRHLDYPELKTYSVRKIIKEDENLYLGTMGKGLALLKPARVKQLNSAVLKQKNIKAIFQASDSSVWIGTKSTGLYRVKSETTSSLTTAEGLLQNTVTTIGSSKGKIYSGSVAGITVIDMDSGKVIGKITQEDGLTSNYVYAVYEDSRDWLWILTRYGGIHYLDENGILRKVSLPETFSNTNFVSILELKDGQIAVGSMNGGLFRISSKGEFLQNQVLPLTPGEDVIYSIYEDEGEDLWFATHGGIVLLKDGEFKTLKKRNGLKSRSVYSITPDRSGGVWTSNNFGVQYFSKDELERFKSSAVKDFFIAGTLYDKGQGMPNSEANGLIFPAAIRDFSGKVWIPTVEGVGVIQPFTISENNLAQSGFVWDELQLGDQKIPIGERVVIPEGVRMFQVSFSLIDFENQAQYSLFYKIDNKKDLWQPIKGQRQLIFNGLKPGSYNLEVKILRNGKLEQHASLPIVVSASVTETTAFKVSFIVVLILLTIFFVKYYFNIKLKKKLEAMVSQRTSELRSTNEQLRDALGEIENQNSVLMDIAWNQSHLVRAPLTKAMGINQLLIKYPHYTEVGKSKEELEIELLETLKKLDQIVKETHAKSENLKNK